MTNLEKEFFNFIYKRQLIWYRRFVLKQKAPWTDDEILKVYKIINMYRELDKCTIYLLDKLKDIRDRKKILLNVVFFRFFNRVGLYEEIGINYLNDMNVDIKSKIESSFENNRQKGRPIFNNAYLISGENGKKKHLSILDNLQKTDFSLIIDEIDCCNNPKDVLKAIQKIPMVGPFLACEIWTDLAYFNFFRQNWTDDDFVNIGPGAKWGLEILYGKLNTKALEDRLNNLHLIQKDYLERANEELNEPLKWKQIAFRQAFSNYPYLSLTNLEGALCEFRKYWNISHGKGRRKYFRPIS